MKIFEGKIVSIGMTNTVVVEVLRITPHPLYKKLIRTTKKYKVDTNGIEDLSVGTVVKITETRPMSKDKYFKVSEVVGSAKQTSKNLKSEKVEKTELKAVSKVAVKEKTSAKKTTKKTVKKEAKK